MTETTTTDTFLFPSSSSPPPISRLTDYYHYRYLTSLWLLPRQHQTLTLTNHTASQEVPVENLSWIKHIHKNLLVHTLCAMRDVPNSTAFRYADLALNCLEGARTTTDPKMLHSVMYAQTGRVNVEAHTESK